MKSIMTVILLAGLPGTVSAVPNENARFALHVKAPLAPEDTTPLCGNGSYDPNEEGLPCSAYTVTRSQTREWPGPVVYLTVGHADSVGIDGVSFGLDYQGGTGTGIDPQWVTWTGCTDGFEFFAPGDLGVPWPWPTSGAIITWATCQDHLIGAEGVHVVVGALSVYAYSEASLQVTGHDTWAGPVLSVHSCDGTSSDLLDLVPFAERETLYPKVRIGGVGEAYNPCWGTGGVPVRATTWGRIKHQYGP